MREEWTVAPSFGRATVHSLGKFVHLRSLLEIFFAVFPRFNSILPERKSYWECPNSLCPSTSLSLLFFNFSTFLWFSLKWSSKSLSLSTLLHITYCSCCLSLSVYRIALFMYFSLFLSSYAHLSLSLSKKIFFSHYKSTIVNKYYIFFIFSWLQIWGFESWNLLQNLDSTHK